MLKLSWKDYGFENPFEMVKAAYVADEKVMITLTGEKKNRFAYVTSVTPTSARVILDDATNEVILGEKDVSWASRF